MFGLTTKIHGFILTRDSAWFLWGRIVGIAALIATTASDSNFGLIDLTWLISPLHLHQIQALAALVTYVSAQLSRSSLPSKADAEKVSLPLQEQK